METGHGELACKSGKSFILWAIFIDPRTKPYYGLHQFFLFFSFLIAMRKIKDFSPKGTIEGNLWSQLTYRVFTFKRHQGRIRFHMLGKEVQLVKDYSLRLVSFSGIALRFAISLITEL